MVSRYVMSVIIYGYLSLQTAIYAQQLKDTMQTYINYYEQGNYKLAIQKFRRLLKHPNINDTIKCEIFQYLGACYRWLGKDDSAYTMLYKAWEINPFMDIKQKFRASVVVLFQRMKSEQGKMLSILPYQPGCDIIIEKGIFSHKFKDHVELRLPEGEYKIYVKKENFSPYRSTLTLRKDTVCRINLSPVGVIQEVEAELKPTWEVYSIALLTAVGKIDDDVGAALKSKLFTARCILPPLLGRKALAVGAGLSFLRLHSFMGTYVFPLTMYLYPAGRRTSPYFYVELPTIRSEQSPAYIEVGMNFNLLTTYTPLFDKFMEAFWGVFPFKSMYSLGLNINCRLIGNEINWIGAGLQITMQHYYVGEK